MRNCGKLAHIRCTLLAYLFIASFTFLFIYVDPASGKMKDSDSNTLLSYRCQFNVHYKLLYHSHKPVLSGAALNMEIKRLILKIGSSYFLQCMGAGLMESRDRELILLDWLL
jgi:hypothetical protein